MNGRLLIAGEWVEGNARETLIDKYSGKPYGEMALASPDQLACSIRTARKASPVTE